MPSVRPLVCLCFAALTAFAQSQEEVVRVYTEHPRLFLRPARLKLLTRERDRRSVRWIQFETLMAGKARMPEPGFASALYYRITGDKPAGRSAIAFALSESSDLRQAALVFDWCQDLLSEAESRALASRLKRGVEQAGGDVTVPSMRSRLLAAIALSDHLQETSDRGIEAVVRGWWSGTVVPALRSGRDVIGRDNAYALFEMLHAVRDNLNLDLRDSAPVYFKTLPAYHLISHYPASYQAPEGEYRIPAGKGFEEPDLYRAALSRAAELTMVAYDGNAPESNSLQGWLMHDAFILRSTFGSPYEFLWANPYQPGLSYYHVPLVFHDERFGRLFVRSNWEESATWLGYFDGELQVFQDGKLNVRDLRKTGTAIPLSSAVVITGKPAGHFRVQVDQGEPLFLVALKPRQAYHVEIDGEEMAEYRTDSGGILQLALPAGVEVGIRMAEYNPAR
jgi:hypothetical protein